MFTGIVTAQGSLRELRAIGDRRDMRLVIAAPDGFLHEIDTLGRYVARLAETA